MKRFPCLTYCHGKKQAATLLFLSEVDSPAISHASAVPHDTKGQSMFCTKAAVIASYLAAALPRP